MYQILRLFSKPIKPLVPFWLSQDNGKWVGSCEHGNENAANTKCGKTFFR
jgi:hypothetical protein